MKKLFLGIILISVIAISCKQNNKTNDQSSQATQSKQVNTLAMSQVWQGPYGGVPPFDKVVISDFVSALESGMDEKRKEIQAIIDNPQAASFENTILALEKTGQTLKRVQAIYYIWTSNMSNPEMDSIQTLMEPRFASFNDSIIQNKALFAKIEEVNNNAKSIQLTDEQKRLLWRYYTTFTLAGAKLDENSKVRVAEINQKLAGLFTQFSQNQLADESDKFQLITNEKDLDGLPENLKAAAAQLAESKNKKGNWIIANTRSAVEPFLTFANNRALREKVWTMFVNRGDNGDANDNNKIIPEILHLRAERAKLLGYKTHAHLRLADKMAQTPERAMALLESVWTPAINRVKEEVKDMQAIADKNGDKIKIEPWDYRYYAEKVRKAKYDLDQNEIKQYLQLEKLREGMFYVAGELFDLSFKQIDGIPVFQSDVRVFEVTNKTSGKHVGLWYFDPYARQGKRSGAWMTAYREQEKLNGDISTIVSNNCNFIKGQANEPILISWDDAETLFHEFGHALHGLCSQVNYPSLSGTNVATDYVEFPSQILERWLSTPEVLQKFAIHYKTGEPMPEALLKKIQAASKFNQGFGTVEYLASALIDMKLHLAGDTLIDPDKFEKETLAALKMPKEIVMRHRTPQFGHIFADDGYSAGYYSYLWSDVISADAYEAFTEAKGGPYDKEVAKRLLDYVFSVGGTMEESEAYRKFRGKDPNKDALMRNRGFISK
ncbi:MAG: M3 family metallopeptidase [Saprospiraceae bacterium]|nr:M3 family metallopeptidase [Saprospiraceae bacterium]